MSAAVDRFLAGEDRLAAVLKSLPVVEPPPELRLWLCETAKREDAARAEAPGFSMTPETRDALAFFEPPASVREAVLREAAARERAQAPRRALLRETVRHAASDDARLARELDGSLSPTARRWLREVWLSATAPESARFSPALRRRRTFFRVFPAWAVAAVLMLLLTPLAFVFWPSATSNGPCGQQDCLAKNDAVADSSVDLSHRVIGSAPPPAATAPLSAPVIPRHDEAMRDSKMASEPLFAEAPTAVVPLPPPPAMAKKAPAAPPSASAASARSRVDANEIEVEMSRHAQREEATVVAAAPMEARAQRIAPPAPPAPEVQAVIAEAPSASPGFQPDLRADALAEAASAMPKKQREAKARPSLPEASAGLTLLAAMDDAIWQRLLRDWREQAMAERQDAAAKQDLVSMRRRPEADEAVLMAMQMRPGVWRLQVRQEDGDAQALAEKIRKAMATGAELRLETSPDVPRGMARLLSPESLHDAAPK